MLDRRLMKEKANKQESQAQFEKRVANNYPSIDNVFYKVFNGAHISDYTMIEGAVRNMGQELYAMGIIKLWDDVTVKLEYHSKDVEINLEDTIGDAYTDYRTNRATESGCYLQMSIVTPLNNKQSKVVEFPIRYKQDFRYLPYIATQLFELALDNFAYSEGRISFVLASIGENEVTQLVNAIKRR